MASVAKKVIKAWRWLAKPIPFRARVRAVSVSVAPSYVLATNKMFHVGYQPDSHADYDTYPEFTELFNRYTKHNKSVAVDLTRLWAFILNIRQVVNQNVLGDFAELGVHQGNSAAILAHYAKKASRRVHLFDTFEGFDSRDLTGVDSHHAQQFDNTSVQFAKDVIGRENASVCSFYPGYFPATATPDVANRQYAVVNLDCDLYAPMKAGLEFFYPRMSPGGICFVHDYSNLGWPGVTAAVDEFCRAAGEHAILMPDKCGSVIIRKTRM